MFSPPGTKIFASRRLNRKRNKMQQTAMKEALAAGWQRYNSDEESSDNDDNNSAVQDLLQIDDTENTDISPSVSMNNEGQIEMNVYLTDSFPNPVSLDGEMDDDDDDDSTVASDDGGDALANDDLYVLLDKLNQQNSPTNTPGLYLVDLESKKSNDEVHECPTSVRMSNEANEPTETKSMENIDTTDAQIAPELSPNISIASSDDEDALSDADSLDLGVPTTVWPSQKENPFVINTTTNANAKRIIADIVTMANVFSPSDKHTMSTPPSIYNTDDNLEDDVDASYPDDGNDDEPHVGTGVFLFTEGVRYSGQGMDASNVGNNLLHIQETSALTILNETESNSTLEEDFPTTRKDLRLEINNDNTIPQNGENCFGSIQLVSPKFFDTGEKPIVSEEEVQPVPVMSPLSSMVHPMNLALFDSKDLDKSLKRRETKKLLWENNNDTDLPKPVDRVPTSILKSIEQEYGLSENENRRSNLSTSFKSSSKSSRIAYHISDGKKSMSTSERLYSKSFLPNYQFQSPISNTRSSSSRSSNRGSLAVLLADLKTKIFEVVAIDVQQDTSVGDVLSKARTSATDPALSEQKYVSFCYGTQEFGAPMLPVNLVIDWEKHKTRPLVVAVPVGSTATEMQSVKRVLWKNPKLRDWWKQDDPFVPKMKTDVETTSIGKSEESPVPKVVDTSTPLDAPTNIASPPLLVSFSSTIASSNQERMAEKVVNCTTPLHTPLVSSLKTYERVEV
jgi:hypothetical protein